MYSFIHAPPSPNRNNIEQHVIHLLSRLGRESCFVTAVLLILYRILTTITSSSSSSHQTLRKFTTTNLTRWMVTSLSVKLITLQSQVTGMDPTTSSLVGDANSINAD